MRSDLYSANILNKHGDVKHLRSCCERLFGGDFHDGSKGEFNPDDQVRRYCQWRGMRYMSSIGTCFDIGNTVSAAVCGQVAGAYYGVSGILEGWLAKLVMRETVEDLADRLCQAQEKDIR